MHIGFLTEDKGVRETLVALAAAIRAGVPAHLVLVGEGGFLGALKRVVKALGLAPHVTATGWQPPDMFPSLPAAADLGVVLRTPTAGETSAAVVRFLACGTPVAASAYQQFLEWPVAAVPRVTPGPGAPAELARLLARAASERRNGRWAERRRQARTAYEAGHRPECTAEDMVAFLGSVAAAG